MNNIHQWLIQLMTPSHSANDPIQSMTPFSHRFGDVSSHSPIGYGIFVFVHWVINIHSSFFVEDSCTGANPGFPTRKNDPLGSKLPWLPPSPNKPPMMLKVACFAVHNTHKYKHKCYSSILIQLSQLESLDDFVSFCCIDQLSGLGLSSRRFLRLMFSITDTRLY